MTRNGAGIPTPHTGPEPRPERHDTMPDPIRRNHRAPAPALPTATPGPTVLSPPHPARDAIPKPTPPAHARPRRRRVRPDPPAPGHEPGPGRVDAGAGIPAASDRNPEQRGCGTPRPAPSARRHPQACRAASWVWTLRPVARALKSHGAATAHGPATPHRPTRAPRPDGRTPQRHVADHPTRTHQQPDTTRHPTHPRPNTPAPFRPHRPRTTTARQPHDNRTAPARHPRVPCGENNTPL